MSGNLRNSEVFADNSSFTDGNESTNINTDTDIVSMAQQHILYKIGRSQFNIRHQSSFSVESTSSIRNQKDKR